MNKKITAFFVTLVLLLFGLLFGLFHVIFEERESEHNIALRGEAVFNPLFIAQRFLEKSGIESESIVSMLKLKELPDTNDVLFLATRRFDIGPALRTKIMAWVASGGHLIVVAWSESDEALDDPILDDLEISVRDKYKSDDELDNADNTCIKKTNKENSDKKESCDEYYFKPIAVTILSGREKSMVAFNPSQWLTSTNEKKANWVINSDSGAHLIEYVMDKGLVTVLSDYEFLMNNNFKKYDHAAFFWYLVHYSNSSGKVWIVYKGDMPPLYAWLVEHMWAPFLTLFFIIAIWIWSVLPRFGAVYPKLSLDRRNLIEHIRASGQFLWKNKFSEGLIHETRNALQEQISKRHPNWITLSQVELTKRLAKHTGLSLENIEFAFTTHAIKKEQEFFLIIQTLERLRKAL